MPNYSFSFINHLGERFLTQLTPCADDEAAIAHGKTLEDVGYPVEIHVDGRRLSLSAIPQWRPDDWLIKALKCPIKVSARAARPQDGRASQDPAPRA